MIVTCERCNAKYKLDEAKVKGRGAKITCPRCRHVFVVYTQDGPTPSASSSPSRRISSSPSVSAPPRDSSPPASAGMAVAPIVTPGLVSAPPVSAPSAPSAPRPTRRSADDLDFRKVGIPTWKVKVKIGLVYDFGDIKTLKKYIQDKRVTVDDVISSDGANWIRIGDIADLNAHFVQIYEDLESQQKESAVAEGRPEEFEDGPTMIVGMGSLGANLSTGVFARPDASEPAPPGSGTPNLSLGANSGAGPSGRSFTDPFDALKVRQRERIQARRSAPEATQKNQNGSSSPSASKSATTRRMVTMAVIVAVVGGIAAAGWWQLQRLKPTPAPAETSATGGGTTSTGTSARDELNRELTEKLKPTDPTEVQPPPDPDADLSMTGNLTPVVPKALQGTPTAPIRPGTPQAPGAVGVQPSSAADYLMVAESLAKAGDWRGAAEAYGKAAALDARPQNQFKHGNALFKAGQANEAQQVLAQAASAGVVEANRVLGAVMAQQGDTSGAMYHYNEYLKSNPSDRAAVEAEMKKLTGG